MLPHDLRITSGLGGKSATVVVDNETGKAFSVLCNCGSSRPRRHTQMYVSKNRHEFTLPVDWAKAQEQAKIQAAATIAAAVPKALNQPEQENSDVPTTEDQRPETESDQRTG